jgi:hypothetical protein
MRWSSSGSLLSAVFGGDLYGYPFAHALGNPIVPDKKEFLNGLFR